MKVAIVATLAALPVAIGFAYLLARTRFPGKTLLDAVLHLPLVLPPVVTGYVLLLLLDAKGLRAPGSTSTWASCSRSVGRVRRSLLPSWAFR